MAEASVPQDLSLYEYNPSFPLPSGREARDHVIRKGPCQPKDINFPLDNRNHKFLVSWYEKHTWLEYSVSLDKAFCFFCRGELMRVLTSNMYAVHAQHVYIHNIFVYWKPYDLSSLHADFVEE